MTADRSSKHESFTQFKQRPAQQASLVLKPPPSGW